MHWITPSKKRLRNSHTALSIHGSNINSYYDDPHDATGRFESLVELLAKQMLALQRQIQNLRRTRDLLLPRLLSGQVNVNAKEP